MKEIDKKSHIEPGKQIKITLANCYDHEFKDDAKLIIPGSIHIIVDRPSKTSRRNGDMGVWVNGISNKVFVRFFGYRPYIPFIRQNPPKMIRTRQPVFRRTK